MSIALAILSRGGTVVGSDGRRFHNGRYTSDSFDKTFCISHRRILGAYTGVLWFTGKTIAEQVEEIVVTKCSSTVFLRDMVGTLCSHFAERMENIDPNEVAFQNRKIDILLADRHTIYGIRFEPLSNNSKINHNIKTYDGAGAYCVCGSDDAKAATLTIMAAQKHQIPGMRAKSLKNLARRAIQKGIESAGPSPGYEQIPSCGGNIYLKYI